MIRKPIKIEQMKTFLMQNANDFIAKTGRQNNVSNNFIDIANYIEQQEQVHNSLREKLKELEWSNRGMCPCCKEVKYHDKNCWLNAELQAIKEE